MSGVNGVQVPDGKIDLIPPPIGGLLPAPTAEAVGERVPTRDEIEREWRVREYASFERSAFGFSAFVSLFQQWTSVKVSGFGSLFAMSGESDLKDSAGGDIDPEMEPEWAAQLHPPGTIPVDSMTGNPAWDVQIDGKVDVQSPGFINNDPLRGKRSSFALMAGGFLTAGCFLGVCLLLRRDARPLFVAARAIV